MNHTSPTNIPGYFKVYTDQVIENDLATAFTHQSEVMKALFPAITAEKAEFSYAPGKWTIKELVQHLVDAERIFSYRALCFARQERAVLPSFDENAYAANSLANRRPWQTLVDEFVGTRRSTLFLYDSFTPEMLASKGQAGNNILSVEEIGFITIGHFTHHHKILKERYLS